VIRKRLVICRPCAQIRGRPWRGGKPSDHVGEDLEELNTAVFQIEPQNLKELAHYQNALRLLTVIADNRGEPIDSANGSVPLFLWFVLIVSGIINLGYPAFFGASNRLAQTLIDGDARCARRALAAACARLGLSLHEAALEHVPPTLPSH